MDKVKTNKNLLLVEDDYPTLLFLKEMLRSMGYQVETASDVESAIELQSRITFPIIISDIQLGDSSGLDLIKNLIHQENGPLLIFITGFGSIQTAVDALQQGAFDYISKPLDLSEIRPELEHALNKAEQHLRSLKDETPNPNVNRLADTKTFVGRSPKLVKMYREIAKASLSDGNVLVTGESGTGKELVARSIHENSKRKLQPLVSVNCGAFSENLLESELFGHVRGAFTDAVANKKGLFEQADGGTLFLDEVGEMTFNLQVRLLRAIQYGEIRSVGSESVKKVNVRIICATNRNLLEMVHQEKFREDLYYRLKVFYFELPPLRERIEDLPELISHFIARASETTGKSIVGLSPEAKIKLENYYWPGNIRELENVISRAVVMANTNILHTEDFVLEQQFFENRRTGSTGVSQSTASHVSMHYDTNEGTLEAIERNTS